MTLQVTAEQFCNQVVHACPLSAIDQNGTIQHVTQAALNELGINAVNYGRLLMELPNGVKLAITPCK